MRYRSRISVLLSVFLVSAFLNPLTEADNISKIVILTIVIAFVISLIVSINYTITEGNLIVRTLGFRMATIPIAYIKSIRRSYNPLSSPAASLKRLEVKFYHNGRLNTALISPVREVEFLERLKEINPNIEMQVPQKRSFLRLWDWDI